MGLWIKVCGITTPDDANAARLAGADAIGVNFHPASKRYCSLAEALEVRRALPPAFPVYGVFVDVPRSFIEEQLASGTINAVQLHGREPREEALGWDVPVLRAVPARDAAALRDEVGAADPYRLLVDNPAGGGSGQPVAAEALEGLDLGSTVLAGGLTPQNVAAKVRRFRPFGVDVAGGVEQAPGLKDHAKIQEFIDHARAARR